jgi:hypothetical protein
VSAEQEPNKPGGFAELLHPEQRLIPRLTGALRLDPHTYVEIAHDPGAIPQAFAVVLVTSLLVGIGQGSLAGIFFGIAWALLTWLLVAALLWGAGTALFGGAHHFAPLLRCLGFSYVWFGLLIGGGLPFFLGPLLGWAALGLCLYSNVLAARAVFDISTQRAVIACALALAVPVLLFFLTVG